MKTLTRKEFKKLHSVNLKDCEDFNAIVKSVETLVSLYYEKVLNKKLDSLSLSCVDGRESLNGSYLANCVYIFDPLLYSYLEFNVSRTANCNGTLKKIIPYLLEGSRWIVNPSNNRQCWLIFPKNTFKESVVYDTACAYSVCEVLS